MGGVSRRLHGMSAVVKYQNSGDACAGAIWIGWKLSDWDVYVIANGINPRDMIASPRARDAIQSGRRGRAGMNGIKHADHGDERTKWRRVGRGGTPTRRSFI